MKKFFHGLMLLLAVFSLFVSCADDEADIIASAQSQASVVSFDNEKDEMIYYYLTGNYKFTEAEQSKNLSDTLSSLFGGSDSGSSKGLGIADGYVTSDLGSFTCAFTTSNSNIASKGLEDETVVLKKVKITSANAAAAKSLKASDALTAAVEEVSDFSDDFEVSYDLDDSGIIGEVIAVSEADASEMIESPEDSAPVVSASKGLSGADSDIKEYNNEENYFSMDYSDYAGYDDSVSDDYFDCDEYIAVLSSDARIGDVLCVVKYSDDSDLTEEERLEKEMAEEAQKYLIDSAVSYKNEIWNSITEEDIEAFKQKYSYLFNGGKALSSSKAASKAVASTREPSAFVKNNKWSQTFVYNEFTWKKNPEKKFPAGAGGQNAGYGPVAMAMVMVDNGTSDLPYYYQKASGKFKSTVDEVKARWSANKEILNDNRYRIEGIRAEGVRGECDVFSYKQVPVLLYELGRIGNCTYNSARTDSTEAGYRNMFNAFGYNFVKQTNKNTILEKLKTNSSVFAAGSNHAYVLSGVTSNKMTYANLGLGGSGNGYYSLSSVAGRKLDYAYTDIKIKDAKKVSDNVKFISTGAKGQSRGTVFTGLEGNLYVDAAFKTKVVTGQRYPQAVFYGKKNETFKAAYIYDFNGAYATYDFISNMTRDEILYYGDYVKALYSGLERGYWLYTNERAYIDKYTRFWLIDIPSVKVCPYKSYASKDFHIISENIVYENGTLKKGVWGNWIELKTGAGNNSAGVVFTKISGNLYTESTFKNKVVVGKMYTQKSFYAKRAETVKTEFIYDYNGSFKHTGAYSNMNRNKIRSYAGFIRILYAGKADATKIFSNEKSGKNICYVTYPGLLNASSPCYNYAGFSPVLKCLSYSKLKVTNGDWSNYNVYMLDSGANSVGVVFNNISQYCEGALYTDAALTQRVVCNKLYKNKIFYVPKGKDLYTTFVYDYNGSYKTDVSNRKVNLYYGSMIGDSALKTLYAGVPSGSLIFALDEYKHTNGLIYLYAMDKNMNRYNVCFPRGYSGYNPVAKRLYMYDGVTEEDDFYFHRILY